MDYIGMAALVAEPVVQGGIGFSPIDSNSACR